MLVDSIGIPLWNLQSSPPVSSHEELEENQLTSKQLEDIFKTDSSGSPL